MDYWTSIVEDAKRLVTTALTAQGIEAPDKLEHFISEPKDSKLGDLTCTVVLSIAKQKGLNPKELADKLVKQMPVDKSFFERIEVAGPGYLNFFIDYAKAVLFIDRVVSEGKEYGKNQDFTGKKCIIEFPGVNPGKPLHVGHLRNAVLGESVARLLQASGYDVTRMDYIDDLGLQVAQLIWGYEHVTNSPDPSLKLDHWQGALYVAVQERMVEPKVEAEVRSKLKFMEEKDSSASNYAKQVVKEGIQAQHRTTQRLGIYHDVMVFESDIVHAGLFKEALELLNETKGVVKESEGKNAGAWVVKLSDLPEFKGMENPDKVIVRSDGTSTYTGKDIAFHLWKFGLIRDPFNYKHLYLQENMTHAWSTCTEDCSPPPKPFPGTDLIVNVIGSAQTYPQEVVKHSLKLLGFQKEANNYKHLAYGEVSLPEGKLSGRKGTEGFTADEVLDLAASRVESLVMERNSELGLVEAKDVGERVGLGAVKFALLKVDALKKVVFTWEQVLNFEGDSGPYVQYALVRAKRVLEKAPEKLDVPNLSLLSTPSERDLLKQVYKFPSVVQEASRDFAPYKVASYLLDLTAKFNAFYRDCPVLTAEGQLKSARLVLTSAALTCLKNGLHLLGVQAPDRM